MMKTLTRLAFSFSLALLAAHAYAAPAALEPNQAVKSASFPEIEKLLKEKKFDDALAAANKATQDFPSSAHAFHILGKVHFYRGQDAAARTAYDKAIALNPTFADAIFARGLTYNFGGTPGAGRADFERAVQLNPNDARYWAELGILEYRAGKMEAAAAALDKSIKLNPKQAKAWFYLGTLAWNRAEQAQAAVMWKNALDLDPTMLEAQWNMGVHHYLHGDAQLALTHFQAVLAQKPNDIDVVKKIIQAYYRLENYDQAAVYRLKLLDLIAKSPDPAMRAIKEFCFHRQGPSPGLLVHVQACQGRQNRQDNQPGSQQRHR